MRPLPSVVIDTDAGLTLRLESGGQVHVPKQKDLRLGDTAYVLFDYTRLIVHDIWTEDEYNVMENDGEEPKVVLPPGWDEPYMWAVDAEVCPVVSL